MKATQNKMREEFMESSRSPFGLQQQTSLSEKRAAVVKGGCDDGWERFISTDEILPDDGKGFLKLLLLP